MRFAPVLRCNARQAKTIRRLTRIVWRQARAIDDLQAQVLEVRADAELVASMIPKGQLELAMAMVRNRRRIAALDEAPESLVRHWWEEKA